MICSTLLVPPALAFAHKSPELLHDSPSNVHTATIPTCASCHLRFNGNHPRLDEKEIRTGSNSCTVIAGWTTINTGEEHITTTTTTKNVFIVTYRSAWCCTSGNLGASQPGSRPSSEQTPRPLREHLFKSKTNRSFTRISRSLQHATNRLDHPLCIVYRLPLKYQTLL